MSEDPDLEVFLQEVIRELRGRLEVEEPGSHVRPATPGPAVIEGSFSGEQTIRQSVVHSAPSLRALGVEAGVRLRPEPAPVQVFEDSKRYTLGQEVGRGGMGRVLVATDPELGRRVALKVLLSEGEKSASKVQRFVEEAQVAAQLEHPNIVPVYDFGVLSGGTPYFTMRFVRGRTLKEILRALRHPDLQTGDQAEFTRARLLGIFRTVCMAVAYAHARGVVHRDVKPQNVMVGSHGEVYVMDWGLAKVFGRRELVDGEVTLTARTGDAGDTVEGTVKGTPQYMSPEQALGDVDHVDERTDIYALGAMLYEILTLVPPFVGQDASDVLARVREEAPVAPRLRAPGRDIPEELETICLRAMAREPWRRFASARELAEEIDAFLEGNRERERRRAEANRRVQAARETAQRYAALTRSAVDLREQAEGATRVLKGWEPIADKEPIWELEDRSAAAEEAAGDAFGEAVHLYTEALAYDPTDADARDGLASLYYAKFLEAEDRREPREARAYRALVEQYDDGRFEALLRGDGRLQVASEPRGAVCEIRRYQESGRRLVPGPATNVGKTPVAIDPLPMGSYVLEAALEGFGPMRVPFLVGRCETVDLRLKLRRPSEVPEGYRLVPAGPFVSGGDPEAFGSPPKRNAHLPDFAIAQYPVTCEDYLDFLNALALRDPAEAALRAPRSESRRGHWWTPGPDGRFSLPSPDREGVVWDGRWPVTGVSFDDAVAFCRWASLETGLALRLPTDLEWEKAARGADGRIHPWGDAFDATFCKMWSSRAGKKGIEPVGAFASDESPYGVRDLAGGVQEWCDGWTDRDENIRVRMGGSWMNSKAKSRAACRYGWPPDHVTPDMGFRLALSLE